MIALQQNLLVSHHGCTHTMGDRWCHPAALNRCATAETLGALEAVLAVHLRICYSVDFANIAAELSNVTICCSLFPIGDQVRQRITI